MMHDLINQIRGLSDKDLLEVLQEVSSIRKRNGLEEAAKQTAAMLLSLKPGQVFKSICKGNQSVTYYKIKEITDTQVIYNRIQHHEDGDIWLSAGDGKTSTSHSNFLYTLGKSEPTTLLEAKTALKKVVSDRLKEWDWAFKG